VRATWNERRLSLSIAVIGTLALAITQLSQATSAHAQPHARAQAPAVTQVRAACPVVPRSRPDPQRTVYTVEIAADPSRATTTGTVTARFTPDLDTDRIVVREWANSPGSGASSMVKSLAIDGQPVMRMQRKDPTTLEVLLPEPIGAGQTVVVEAAFTLVVTGQSDERWSRGGATLRLGNFIPVLPWEPGVGWNTTAPTVAHGEASMNPVADYRLTVVTDPKLTVLGTGAPQQAAGRWTFTAPAVRDVAVSIGAFRTATAVVGTAGPEPVTVTVGVAPGIAEKPGAYLQRITVALSKMAKLYGPAPYPWLSVALTPGLRGGIEFPGHVMQGPKSIGRTTPHEVAHQWFYGLVGNDQGRDPWIDEGLATWAEGRLDGTTAAFVSKAIPTVGRAKTGRPMSYWNQHRTAYYRSVYVQTVHLLHSFKDPARVDCVLNILSQRHAFDVVTVADVISVFEEEFPEAEAVFARFGITP
jgi:hypothetical protein